VGGYVSGPPELIVEVSVSSRPYDLGPKKRDYRRAGVQEYLFVGLDPEEVCWFALRGGRYRALRAGADGVYRSEVFPGLWLDPRAPIAGDTEGLIAALERGLATPEHAAFVARLGGR
jgi:Uma2 family endonuclease